MPIDHIRYDLLAQAALRSVVQTVLADAARKGLPGDHHFKITFATGAPGVRLSERMRLQYPQTMMIILQHQFWDLAVRDDAFDVGLSFGGIAEKLTVPFDAITAFYDPSVQFGFQFESLDAEAAARAAAEPSEAAPSPERIPAAAGKSDDLPGAAAAAEPQAPEAGGDEGAQIVRLDRFRKK